MAATVNEIGNRPGAPRVLFYAGLMGVAGLSIIIGFAWISLLAAHSLRVTVRV